MNVKFIPELSRGEIRKVNDLTCISRPVIVNDDWAAENVENYDGTLLFTVSGFAEDRLPALQSAVAGGDALKLRQVALSVRKHIRRGERVVLPMYGDSVDVAVSQAFDKETGEAIRYSKHSCEELNGLTVFNVQDHRVKQDGG